MAQLAASQNHLKIYKKLVSLRKFDVLKSGTFEVHLTNNEKVLVYKREVSNGNVVVVALNFDKVSQQVNLQAIFPKIPKMMYAYTSSLDSGITAQVIFVKSYDMKLFKITICKSFF